jgi:curved DNA-binding protein CbpA
MVDYFELLEEPRRPWIDPELLKEKFLSQSTKVHPDRVHGADEPAKLQAQQRYTELNAAYNCLREPKDRLRHLLELELGAKPKEMQSIPDDLMALFMEVSGLCRAVDEFLKEKAAVTSPLLLVKIFERGQEWTEKLMALQQRMNTWRDELLVELKSISAGWESVSESDSAMHNAALQRIEKLHRLLSYFARWGGQIHERIAQIGF